MTGAVISVIEHDKCAKMIEVKDQERSKPDHKTDLTSQVSTEQTIIEISEGVVLDI